MINTHCLTRWVNQALYQVRYNPIVTWKSESLSSFELKRAEHYFGAPTPLSDTNIYTFTSENKEEHQSYRLTKRHERVSLWIPMYTFLPETTASFEDFNIIQFNCLSKYEHLSRPFLLETLSLVGSLLKERLIMCKGISFEKIPSNKTTTL